MRVIEHLERIFVALEQTRCSEDLEAPVDADQELRRADPGLDGALLGAFDLPRDGAELARWIQLRLDTAPCVLVDGDREALHPFVLRVVERRGADPHRDRLSALRRD